MRTIAAGLVVLFFVNDTWGATPDPPIENKRVRVSTLVREDIFAGWMDGDMKRFARGEKNLDILLESRPRVRPETLAWKGGTKIFRAVLAHEAGNTEEFERYFKEGRDLFAEAKKLGPKQVVVSAVVGGSYLLFADRLPEKYREAAWTESYDNYRALWDRQGEIVDKLPLHIGGELLAGLTQSAQRTGHTEEVIEYLNKIIEVLPDSHYAEVAQEWKADPAAAAKDNIGCKYCHEEGRLSARLEQLKEK